MYNKESILKQIEETESHIRGLKTLIATDLLIGEENEKVGLYCCEKAKLQLTNIQAEISGKDNPEQKLAKFKKHWKENVYDKIEWHKLIH